MTRFSRIGALLTAAVGTTVFVGWLAGIGSLRSVSPGLASMKVNTALAFLAAGVALWLLLRPTVSALWPARILAGAVAAIGGLTLSEDLFGIALGIDQLILRDAVSTVHPGRMAPATALCFLLVGLGLLTLKGPRSSRRSVRASWFALPALFVSTVALAGYAYGVRSLYKVGPYTSMAVHTAACFFVLCLAILAADPTRGFGKIFVSETAGGILARRLLPSIPLLLFGLGWARLAGQDAGLYDTRFGLALMVVLSIAVSVLAVASTAVKLHAMDLERMDAQDAVKDANAGLERRVQERTQELEDSLAQVSRLGAARQEAEATLVSERSLLDTVVRSMGAGVITADASGKFVLFNPAAERLMGAGMLASSPEEWARDYCVYRVDGTTPFPSEDLPLGRALKGESSDAVEMLIARPGHSAWLSVSSRPLRDPAGAVTGGVAVFTDVTERREAAAEIAAVNDRLQRTVADLERLNAEKTSLADLGDALHSCLTLEEAYAEVELAAVRIFPNSTGELFAVNPSQNLMLRVAEWGNGAPSGIDKAFDPNDCWAARRRKVHAALGSEGGLCPHVPRPNRNRHVCAPLTGQDGTIGVIHVEISAEDGRAPVNPDEMIRSAAAAASLVAPAFTSIRLMDKLRFQSIRDPLTGLFNRRYMEESLKREIERAKRGKGHVGVIMLDVDHFKRLNDEQGHAAGDSVLRELGALLASQVRAADIACRYGGEEFALILPDADLEETFRRAEVVRIAVAGLSTRLSNGAVAAPRVSQGVAAFPEHGETPAELLQAADGALYQAKRGGRNRVERAAPVAAHVAR